MRQSRLFTHTRKEAPKDEVAKNAQLLIRAGFIFKEMAGVYTLLPLGFRVMKNIERIIREEMNAIGGQEILMTTLQDPKLWEKSGRWDDAVIDVWFKTQLHQGSELGIANTHEEALTNILREYVASHRDIPAYVYQIQTKFRNELRAKSGIMRTREFQMKDLYSFNADEAGFREFYEQCAQAYMRIFTRAGIGDVTYRTFASGGSFSEFSDEFQTITDAGEDTIYVDDASSRAVNKEVYSDDVLAELGLSKENMREARSIEVGNIFPLGTRFPEAIGLTYTDESGEKRFPYMGSYGIGLGRLMGAIVEVLSDEKGMVWPAEVAPFRAHLLSLAGTNADVAKQAMDTYNALTERGIEVLFDDRDVRAGEKFADADLIGIPTRVVVSEKTMTAGGIEVSDRANGGKELVPESSMPDYFLKR